MKKNRLSIAKTFITHIRVFAQTSIDAIARGNRLHVVAKANLVRFAELQSSFRTVGSLTTYFNNKLNRFLLTIGFVILSGMVVANTITGLSLKGIISTLILIVLSAFFGGTILMKSDVTKLEENNFDRPQYYTISLDAAQVKTYIEILEETLNTTKIYLRPGLSLSELSLMTNIPKHHFSNLLNVHIGKAFYQYISEYRIQEAISRIENDDNITVESLSYECGFNSKTSFNRYFKNVTGYTPSEYRKVKMGPIRLKSLI